MIFQHVDQNDRYQTHFTPTLKHQFIPCSVKRLSWHGIIPDDEVWVTFHREYLCVHCLWGQGHDCKYDGGATAIHPSNQFPSDQVLEVYKLVNITNIHLKMLLNHRGKRIRIFLFGDYQFLCKAYGISGASGTDTWLKICKKVNNFHPPSGRHCCQTTADEMKRPLQERGPAPLWSLHTLQRDYLQFHAVGKGNIKNAKHYNNVIGKPFFDIPLTQVYTQFN